ncbi:MAG: asparagine synthase (glutamine-hydrolyzing) [Steroidobacteraceae bacterium]
MCGITGYFSTNARGDLGRALQGMTDAIAHRGPDDVGYFESITSDGRARVGLGHRRLSIIDLSTGHQPLGNADGSVQIVFNGEIYNFETLRDELSARGCIFRTRSDTEAIVHAYQEWGTDCVLHLRGMFAFAIWDARRGRLFLARDRFGKKPLFIHSQNGTLLFASEIKALLRFPGVVARVNRAALRDYFRYRYVPAPATLFADVRKLMPGSWMTCDADGMAESRFYLPPDGASLGTPLGGPDPVGGFLELLEQSVRIRMISDVPFGAFLSGGLDSSAVVALMARHSSLPVKTFSVGFSETDYSELPHARTIAELFRTEHHELMVSQAHLLEHLPQLTRFRDAPVAEPSDIPIYLLAREARRTVKMVLTGEGSDEMLGGYPKHVYERYAVPYQRLPRWLRQRLIEPTVQMLPYRFRRAKTAIANLGIESRAQRMPRWFGALSEADCARLLMLPPPPAAQQSDPLDVAPGDSPLRAILFFDQTSWLPDNLLERGDRMTMGASLEARMPFLDHELAAFVSALPDAWRVRGFTTKRLLRLAMRRLLPQRILQRPKVGFRVPINEWFRTSMREYLLTHLAGSDSRTRDYYRPEQLRRILQEHIDGRHNHEKLLWCLLNLEIWHREFSL